MHLHVYSSSLVVTAFTSFTCWSSKLATNVLNLLCIHKVYIIIMAVITDIIAIINTNISTMKLLVITTTSSY